VELLENIIRKDVRMRRTKFYKDYVLIEFEKPMYWDKIYIWEDTLNKAIKRKIPIKVKMDKVVYVISDVKKWKNDGEYMEKRFKKPEPMKLRGNFLKNLAVEENLQGVIDGVISANSALMRMAEADPAKWNQLGKLLHSKTNG
jgi:hypothetical protein